MFYVISKSPESLFDEKMHTRRKKAVYSVQYKNGYPFFTFYINGRWVTESAEFYEPVD